MVERNPPISKEVRLPVTYTSDIGPFSRMVAEKFTWSPGITAPCDFTCWAQGMNSGITVPARAEGLERVAGRSSLVVPRFVKGAGENVSGGALRASRGA